MIDFNREMPRIRRMRRQRKTYKEIAAAIGCHETTLYTAVKDRLTISERQGVRSRRLGRAMREKMDRLKAKGLGHRLIASRLKVDRRVVERYFRNELTLDTEEFHCREHGTWLFGYCPICNPPHSEHRCGGVDSDEHGFDLLPDEEARRQAIRDAWTPEERRSRLVVKPLPLEITQLRR